MWCSHVASWLGLCATMVLHKLHTRLRCSVIIILQFLWFQTVKILLNVNRASYKILLDPFWKRGSFCSNYCAHLNGSSYLRLKCCCFDYVFRRLHLSAINMFYKRCVASDYMYTVPVFVAGGLRLNRRVLGDGWRCIAIASERITDKWVLAVSESITGLTHPSGQSQRNFCHYTQTLRGRAWAEVRRFYQSIPCSYLQNEGERRRIKRKKREGGKNMKVKGK